MRDDSSSSRGMMSLALTVVGSMSAVGLVAALSRGLGETRKKSQDDPSEPQQEIYSKDFLLLANEAHNRNRQEQELKEAQTARDVAVAEAAAAKIARDDALAQAQAAQTAVLRIRENQQLIRTVLHFWFGQYPPTQSQKQIWMIRDHQQRLPQKDREIVQRFGHLLLELSSPTDDRWNEWCHDELYGFQGKLAAILVLDQFSRHVHRYLKAQGDDKNTDVDATLQLLVSALQAQLPIQSDLDKRAYQTAVELWEQHGKVECTTGMLATAPMLIFALMPFRHQATVTTVRLTQERTEALAAVQQECEASIRAFRKATNRRLAVLQDEARRTGTDNINEPDSGVMKSKTLEERGAAVDSFTDDDILECFPFQTDMTAAREHPVLVTVRNFLAQQGIHPNTPPPDSTSSNITIPQKQRTILVSLSGGVDSMVLAAVLVHLRDHLYYQHLHIVAVHIDYANRPESAAEAAYVKRFCEEPWQIDCNIRRIDEVTRGVTERNDYERVAREIRFSLYRDTIRQCQSNGDQEAVDVGVVLGHHRGDLRENVLSNAHRGCGPLDLSGMTSTSRNDGVTLFRPLLPLEKETVFDYAHTFGVPYFKDTTPHWSTRGRLRNKLLPLLEEVYGEGSMNNLSRLAVESDECRAIFHQIMVQPFLQRIVRHPMGVSFPTAPWRDQALFFWKLVLRQTVHSVRLGMFTDKSVLSFTERTCQNNPREGWMQCRKDYGVYLRADGTVFVMYPESFPWHNDDQYNCGGKVDYGCENSVQVGPWKVSAEILYKDAESVGAKYVVEERAYTSMEQFMSGNLTYCVRVPTWETEDGDFEPQPLVFTKFSKRVRPRSWKGLDAKIQETLPTLGCDEKAVKALQHPVESGAVHTLADGNLSKNPVMVAKVTLTLTPNDESR